MNNKLLLATTNPGKIKEIKASLAKFPLQIESLAKLEAEGIFPETGKTFKENARGKCLFYSRRREGFTLAEDSGLEIDSLQGAPGVISARFSGPNASDEQNIAKVLQLLGKIPWEQRTARFVSCIALSHGEKIIFETQESAEGFIALQKRGKGGFGYDPIFYYPPCDKSFAELSSQEKNLISHRGQAIKKLKSFLTFHLPCDSSS